LCVAKRERHHVIATPIQVSGVRSRARGDAAAGLAMAQPSPCGYVSIPRSVDPLGCAPTQMRWGNAEGGDVKATKGWCASLHGSVSTGMRPTRPRLGEGRENTKGPRISRPRTRQSIALAHEGVDERLGGARGVCGALHAGRHRGAESGGGRDGGHLPELGNETRRSKLGISTQTQEESAPCGSPDVAGRWPSRCYARRAWPRPPLACARCWRSRTTHTPVRAGFKPFSCSPPSRLRLGSSATGVAGGEAAQGRATARRAFHPKISKARSCGNAQGGWCGDSHSQRHGAVSGRVHSTIRARAGVQAGGRDHECEGASRPVAGFGVQLDPGGERISRADRRSCTRVRKPVLRGRLHVALTALGPRAALRRGLFARGGVLHIPRHR
jgi:hypothetical protein